MESQQMELVQNSSQKTGKVPNNDRNLDYLLNALVRWVIGTKIIQGRL